MATTLDIRDEWGAVMSILDQQVGLERYSGPGGWNDPDILEVGNGRMSDTEYREHFALWALLNAPLFAGNDLRAMSEETARILTDRDLLAVNQDWAGIQGHQIRDDGDTEVWAKPTSDGSRAVVLLNRADGPNGVGTTARELGLPAAPSYAVRDLWSKRTYESRDAVTAPVPAHGAAVFRVWPGTPATPLVTVGVRRVRHVESGARLLVPVTVATTGRARSAAPRWRSPRRRAGPCVRPGRPPATSRPAARVRSGGG